MWYDWIVEVCVLDFIEGVCDVVEVEEIVDYYFCIECFELIGFWIIVMG